MGICCEHNPYFVEVNAALLGFGFIAAMRNRPPPKLPDTVFRFMIQWPVPPEGE